MLKEKTEGSIRNEIIENQQLHHPFKMEFILGQSTGERRNKRMGVL